MVVLLESSCFFFYCEHGWLMLGSELPRSPFHPLTCQDLALTLKRLSVPGVERYSLFGGDIGT